jgi:hypothetical protein
MTERRESDSWMANDLTVGSGATESKILSVPGGDTISGIIDRSSSYDVNLVWISNDESTDINTESVASGATGATEFSEDFHSAQNVRVEVTDTSSSSDTADITVNAR